MRMWRPLFTNYGREVVCLSLSLSLFVLCVGSKTFALLVSSCRLQKASVKSFPFFIVFLPRIKKFTKTWILKPYTTSSKKKRERERGVKKVTVFYTMC